MSDNQPGESDPPQVPGHRVDAVLGAGASAVVWSGADATGRPVAIKVPNRRRATLDAEQSLVEQQVLLAVRHDHLVPLRSVVPLPDGREALVFDLVEGAPLGGMVRSRGHLRAGEVVTVLTPVCEAVAHLHAAGGVHSDISPSNVMVTPEGRPVLLDLGAVRVAGAEPGAVHGTLGFVAPEVRLGAEPAEAADVYAVGALAWFCLTGNGAPDTMMRLDTETVVSHVGPELAAVVASAIDPEPERRPGAAELARLFYDAAPPEPVEVVVDVDPAAALTHRLRAEARHGAPDAATETGNRRPAWVRWPRPAVAAAAMVAVPLVGLAAWALAAHAPPQRAAVVTAPHTAPTARTPGARPAAVGGPSAATTPRAGGASPTSAEAPDAVLRDPTGPARRPEDVLQALSDRRASALRSRDPKALRAVHAPASPSLASDEQLVGDLVKADTRWKGLRLEVAEARFVSGSPIRAVLRARVDWTAYAIVVDGYPPVAKPADKGRQLDFTLTRGKEGWRLSAVSAAPAT